MRCLFRDMTRSSNRENQATELSAHGAREASGGQKSQCSRLSSIPRGRDLCSAPVTLLGKTVGILFKIYDQSQFDTVHNLENSEPCAHRSRWFVSGFRAHGLTKSTFTTQDPTRIVEEVQPRSFENSFTTSGQVTTPSAVNVFYSGVEGIHGSCLYRGSV